MDDLRWILGFIAVLVVFVGGKKTKGGSSYDSDMVVHLVPYSVVSEVGLERFDDLFETKVKVILDSVLGQLDHNMRRTFVWNENIYFERWYTGLSYEGKNRVRRVVDDGQLQFATPISPTLNLADSSTSPTKTSWNYFTENFGSTPVTAFLPSSHGFSPSTPLFLSSHNISSIIFDDTLSSKISQFKKLRHMEFQWKTESSPDTSLFSHLLAAHDDIAENFDFESPEVRPVTNAKKRSESFVKYLKEQAMHYRTNHVLVPIGGDLRYLNAQKQYVNFEKLMKHINQNVDGVFIQFSTFDSYISKVRNIFPTNAGTQVALPVFKGDIAAPNIGDELFSTGVYASYAGLKGMIKACEFERKMIQSFYPFAESLSFGIASSNRPEMIRHEKQVSFVSSLDLTTKIQKDMRENIYASLRSIQKTSAQLLAVLTHSILTKEKHMNADVSVFTDVPYTFTEDSLGVYFPIVFINPSSEIYTHLYTMPCSISYENLHRIQVLDAEMNEIPSFAHQTVDFTDSDTTHWMNMPRNNVLSFYTEVPPLGLTTYFIYLVESRQRLSFTSSSKFELLPTSVMLPPSKSTKSSSSKKIRAHDSIESVKLKKLEKDASKQVYFTDTSALKLEIDTISGLIHSIEDKKSGKRILLRQGFKIFGSDDGSVQVMKGVRTGYSAKFGPDILVSETVGGDFIRIEVQGRNFNQVIWLMDEYIEVDIAVPSLIKKSDFLLTFETSLDTKKTFYTRNYMGLEEEHQINENLPSEASFKSSNNLLLKDRKGSAGVWFSMTQSVASSSLGNGKAGFVLRRNYLDENTGLENKVMHIKCRIFILGYNHFHPYRPTSLYVNPLSMKLFDDPTKWTNKYRTQYSILSSDFMKLNSRILSLESISSNTNELAITMDTPSDFTSYKSILSPDIVPAHMRLASNRITEYVLDDVYRKQMTLTFSLQLTSVKLTNTFKPAASKDEAAPPTKDVNADRKVVLPDISVNRGGLERGELLEVIDSNQKLKMVLQSKIRRIQSSIADLHDELSLFSASNVEARQFTESELSKLEVDLQEVTQRLGTVLQEQKSAQASLELLDLSSTAFSLETRAYYSQTELNQWEATLHGAVTGAGSMLVIMLLYNLMCKKLSKLPRVPIKWVGFQGNQPETLPVHKKN